jgi:hypothetical protein
MDNIYALGGGLQTRGGKLILLSGRQGLFGIDKGSENLAKKILRSKDDQITTNY